MTIGIIHNKFNKDDIEFPTELMPMTSITFRTLTESLSYQRCDTNTSTGRTLHIPDNPKTPKMDELDPGIFKKQKTHIEIRSKSWFLDRESCIQKLKLFC